MARSEFFRCILYYFHHRAKRDKLAAKPAESLVPHGLRVFADVSVIVIEVVTGVLGRVGDALCFVLFQQAAKPETCEQACVLEVGHMFSFHPFYPFVGNVCLYFYSDVVNDHSFPFVQK